MGVERRRKGTRKIQMRGSERQSMDGILERLQKGREINGGGYELATTSNLVWITRGTWFSVLRVSQSLNGL